jgi:hypothetical protein
VLRHALLSDGLFTGQITTLHILPVLATTK